MTCRKFGSLLFYAVRAVSATGKIYEQEVVFLKQQLMQINEKGNEIWRYVTNMRTELYDEVRKQLYKKVSANGYKRRRKSNTQKDGE